MAKGKRALLDDVLGTLPTERGVKPWYETVPPDLAEELRIIKEQWLSGKLPATKTGLGYTLSRALKSRGVTIGHSGVIRWLERP